MTICKKCGGDRYDAHGHCVPCHAESNARYRAKNADKISSIGKRYYEDKKEIIKSKSKKYRDENIEKNKITRKEYCKNNKEKIDELREKWRSANPEKVKKTRDTWLKNNPEYVVAKNHRRRARKVAAGGSFTKQDVHRLFELQKGLCPVCLSDLKKGYHADHITPLARGGDNSAKNIQLLCKPCNQKKHAKCPIEFMQSAGFLL